MDSGARASDFVFVSCAKTQIAGRHQFSCCSYPERGARKPSPVAKFIKDLRNYLLHYALPSTVHETRINAERNEEVTKVYIETDPLLKWPRWNPLSRQYIQAHSPRIRILDLVREYEDLSKNFNNWFTLDFAKGYEPQLKSLQALQKEWNHLSSWT